MKKGNTYVGIVERVEFPNRGIVTIECDENGGIEDKGSKVIVKNVIPGQKIKLQVNKKRGGRCEGRFQEVLVKSNQETQTPCEHFGRCGGCVYQTMSYEEQLKMKSDQVKALLDEVITESYVYEDIIGSPVFEGYRNKMEFSFGDECKDGALALGMHKRNSMHDIVTVDSCKIVDEDYRKILNCVYHCYIESGLPFYHKFSHEGYFRHLIVRKAVKTGGILVNLVTTTQLRYDLTGLADRLKALKLNGKIVGFLHTKNDSLSDAVINEGMEIVFGEDCIYEELLGLRFKISPFSFFQTNSLGAEVLYSKAREYIGETSDKVIFDLYSGTGTIAQMLAPVANKVIGVEIVEEAVESAKINAELNHLDNCEFIAGDVLKVIDDVEDRPDLIVLDPPRDGIHPKALEKIIDYGVDRIVYISCKPTSLARDLVTLQERGYKVEKAGCVDMFPDTANVESIILMTKCGSEDKK